MNQLIEWDQRGIRVELVTFRDGQKFYPEEMPKSVQFTHLGTRSKLATQAALWRYLVTRKPKAVLSVNHIANAMLGRISVFPGIRSKLFLSVPNTFSQKGVAPGSPPQRRYKAREVRRLYPRSDGIVAVSEGVRADLIANFSIPEGKVRTIYNGSVTSALFERGREEAGHAWLDHKQGPVILGAGGLRAQKDFGTLIKAFSKISSKYPLSRLVILGEGPDRALLENTAEQLGVAERVDLPGHVDNPYAYMDKADVFALSSAWEGLVNVVIEALALGAKVVATDCPSGPREILENGKYGILVPVRDEDALAAGLNQALSGQFPSVDPVEATRRFRSEVAAEEYLRYMGLG